MQRCPQALAHIAAVLRGGAQEDERADLVAVVAGDHRILDQRVAGGDQLDADRAGVDPGAGRELEILGDAAIENDALRRIVGIGELDRVADPIEVLLIEGGLRQVRPLVIARHHVRPAHAHLELAGGGHELQLAFRNRQPDRAVHLSTIR